MKTIGNFFAGIVKFFKAVIAELKKVTWPGRKQVINNTGVVIVCIIIIGIAIWILDAVLGLGLSSLISDVAGNAPEAISQ